MNPTVLFLTSLGQALSTRGLYADGHPMRATSRDRVHAALDAVLRHRGALRISFLDGTVIVGTRMLSELRGWEWAPRLAGGGVQRLEIDAVPAPTPDDVELLLRELHQRLAPGVDTTASVALRCFRFGPLGVETASDECDQVVGDLLDAMSQLPMTEEASAVRWIHDEIAAGGNVPMAEVEAVVHSLAVAMQREQHIVLPLLDIKTYDQYTTTHSCNVAMLSMGLADQLGLSPQDRRAIGTAALLHDIGKVRVPTEILVKPGILSADEMAFMRAHSLEGARILSTRGRGHALAATVAYEHHVWEDGSGGYPVGRWPRRCHFASRLVHVCDLYDALSTRRPYRDAWPKERTIRLLRDQSGVEVDGDMVHAMVAMLERSAESRTAPVDLDVPRDGWSGDIATTSRQMNDSARASAPSPIGVEFEAA